MPEAPQSEPEALAAPDKLRQLPGLPPTLLLSGDCHLAIASTPTATPKSPNVRFSTSTSSFIPFSPRSHFVFKENDAKGGESSDKDGPVTEIR